MGTNVLMGTNPCELQELEMTNLNCASSLIIPVDGATAAFRFRSVTAESKRQNKSMSPVLETGKNRYHFIMSTVFVFRISYFSYRVS